MLVGVSAFAEVNFTLEASSHRQFASVSVPAPSVVHPAVQLEQELLPTASAYLPRGQLEHDSDGLTENFPGAQSLQAASWGTANVPAAQTEQAALPITLSEIQPTPYVSTHDAHDADPETLAKKPAVQFAADTGNNRASAFECVRFCARACESACVRTWCKEREEGCVCTRVRAQARVRACAHIL